MFATLSAIAPLSLPSKEDGSVVTWGDADYGGNSDAVKFELHGWAYNEATVAVHALWC